MRRYHNSNRSALPQKELWHHSYLLVRNTLLKVLRSTKYNVLETRLGLRQGHIFYFLPTHRHLTLNVLIFLGVEFWPPTPDFLGRRIGVWPWRLARHYFLCNISFLTTPKGIYPENSAISFVCPLTHSTMSKLSWGKCFCYFFFVSIYSVWCVFGVGML